ncbi:conserved hypothetical protein [Methylocella silvestris BL2]|uniref:Uncharacterized protein n=1 Tax=Methylocella silvestris (strain DSM 15510 / CIP 108128 / LMG 27833 / NCIMB 13906 / BL2) TaxID=395965 RepID=B8ESZ2_METSB|nr:hypothetical protein [Methylocella silvestris]ACK51130.1 conserved hypothetical protein [Methylocella silvestris BL2]
MEQHNRYASKFAALALMLPLGGCETQGAPQFILFGAYFPGWMFCALLGIFGAIGARILMVISGLSGVLPYQLFICIAVGLVIAVACWLFWFGR